MSEIMSALERRSRQCLSIGLVSFLVLLLLVIVGRTPILPLADSVAFGPFSLFCDWVLAVFMPIDDRLRLLLIINNGSDRRSSSAANSPSDYKLGQAAECGMGLGYAAFRCVHLCFCARFSLFLGFHLGNIIFAVVSFGNLYEIFGITLTFAIYVHMRPVSVAVSVTALLWLPSRHALNEIVIKCFNIEVTKGPATLA